MNDRELLELAAKAAGIEGGWGPVFKIGDDEVDVSDIWFLDAPETGSIWDPLTDDGDALRLAVKLHLSLTLNSFGAGAGGVDRNLRQVFKREKAGSDGLPAATRLAIVLAAAEIGRFEP